MRTCSNRQRKEILQYLGTCKQGPDAKRGCSEDLQDSSRSRKSDQENRNLYAAIWQGKLALTSHLIQQGKKVYSFEENAEDKDEWEE